MKHLVHHAMHWDALNAAGFHLGFFLHDVVGATFGALGTLMCQL